jgi:hypothetical protein
MKLLVQIALAGSLTALSLGLARAQDTFDFENQAANIGLSIATSPTVAAEAPSVRTLTLSQSGLTAPPSASSGFAYLDNNAGGSVIFGNNLSGVSIGNAGDGTALETLTLTFTQAITGLTFQFVTFPVALNAPIELNALSDTGLSVSSAGTQNLTTGNGEGSLTLSGSPFTSVSLSLNSIPQVGGIGAAVGDTFIVDTFVVTPSVLVVPEPGVLALFAGVAAPLAWRLRRRR